MLKSERYVVSTNQMEKIALSNNDDKRLIDFNGITTHAYGSNLLERSVKMNY